MGNRGIGGGSHRLVSIRTLIVGLLGLSLALGAGCSSRPKHVRKPAPAAPASVSTPAYHTVKKGDTLSEIAFRYDLDYRAVARWNGIRPPYRIYPGQRIRLHPPKGGEARSTARPPPKKSATGKATSRPKGRTARSGSKPEKRDGAAASRIAWAWPTEGKIVRRFKPDSPGRKGIDIAGRPGQPVRAAAAGKVVYAGSGLRGYGALIIIKHNNTYLSAYAHNRRLLVKEGQRVRKGQQIAELGATGTDSPKLHFEIRRNGKPVDPLRYLPRR
jgi:lipoprotein NlpD